jgi:2-polyprenyl-3-methyl-5-hydroxy-6-metoxy-1,4-benzoquinol methylase
MECYKWFHERHRVFPEIFEDRKHRKVIDLSAGIGVVASQIAAKYPCSMTCNEVDETCLNQLRALPVELVSFDLDGPEPYPLLDISYDAVICLATLEHLIHIDHFAEEVRRILTPHGRLYLSVPNYASLYWMLPLLRGRTFHDPFDPRSRYEFYAHVRYFTYYTVVQFMEHFGFRLDTVYLPLPKGSTRFQQIRAQSILLAFLVQNCFRLLYLTSPRWHQEPVICFSKETPARKPRRVIL